jgi:hypothetical protein
MFEALSLFIDTALIRLAVAVSGASISGFGLFVLVWGVRKIKKGLKK